MKKSLKVTQGQRRWKKVEDREDQKRDKMLTKEEARNHRGFEGLRRSDGRTLRETMESEIY
jgi:hypothetical protein